VICLCSRCVRILFLYVAYETTPDPPAIATANTNCRRRTRTGDLKYIHRLRYDRDLIIRCPTLTRRRLSQVSCAAPNAVSESSGCVGAEYHPKPFWNHFQPRKEHACSWARSANRTTNTRSRTCNEVHPFVQVIITSLTAGDITGRSPFTPSPGPVPE
jgi:hypothetical protein